MNIKILTALLLVTLVSCSEQKVDTKAEEGKIKQTIKDWTQLLTKDSLERTLSFWTDDAIMMMPGQPTVQGKNAIREW
jgi:ketosteroid isomerase-like protein